MFLHCSTNNKAETVYNLFINAIEEHGLPSRVRGDQGVENVDAAWFMFTHRLRGPGRGSYISGKSCHNQRIERFWRDLFHGCLFIFYHIFGYLEDNGLLDISNDNDLYCLHFVFLQRINRHLHLFQDGYDNHALSSECNNTPMQLWIEGMQNYQTTQPSGLSGEDIEHYGIDWEGPLPSERYDGPTYRELEVSVPIIHCLLSDDQIDQFVSAVYPLAESSSHGIDLYLNARDCLESLLNNNSV